MKDEVIGTKDLHIKNLKNEVANGRRHRFDPTTEQRNRKRPNLGPSLIWLR